MPSGGCGPFSDPPWAATGVPLSSEVWAKAHLPLHCGSGTILMSGQAVGSGLDGDSQAL